jgi:hypothetical protein
MKRRALPLALLALLAAALGLRLCAPPSKKAVDLPPSPPAGATNQPVPFVAPETAVAPPSTSPPAPERLRPWIEALGRAAVLRDVRRRAELRASTPHVLDSDVAWLVVQLRGDLFAGAGAAELLTGARPGTAVAAMAALLAEPGRPILKDALLEQLARAGGDAAAAAVVTALREDGDEGVRARCARALRSFQGPEAYAALVLALKDGAAEVRRAAAASMASMSSPDLFQVLFESLLAERDFRVQSEIVAVFDRFSPDNPAAVGQLLRYLPPEREAELNARRGNLLDRTYPLGYFTPGREAVPFDPLRGRRIGITVELGGVKMSEVALAIFSEPPFDRFREWFYLRNEAEFPSATAYDFLGRPMGDVSRGELEGTVYLRFRDPKHFQKGVLGYARGCEAFVQKVSLLHEIGHALGALGDEYPEGSPPPFANVAGKREVPWAPLIRGGHLPQPFLREEGVWIPAETCHMNNNAAGQVDYCPVCQLALIGRIAELAGAPVPAR